MEYSNRDRADVWFDSFEDMEKQLPVMLARRPHNQRHYQSTQHKDNSGWFGPGSTTSADIQRYVRDGWPLLAQIVKRLALGFEPILETLTAEAQMFTQRRRKRIHTDTGDSLNMQKVWAGDLEHAWSRSMRTPRLARGQRYATIFINLAANAAIVHNDAVWRAVAAMLLHDLYQRAGYAMEIWIGNGAKGCYENGPNVAHAGVRVKAYDDPLNEERLAAMCSVGMHRVYGFKMRCAANHITRAGLGMPTNQGMIKPLEERLSLGERVIKIEQCFNHSAVMGIVTRAVTQLNQQDNT